MKLIKFPLPNVTNDPNKTDISLSLSYQDWEIDEVIENLSEDEQDLLIEKISSLVQEWELTLDAKLELSLQTKYKDSKTSLNYTDWLYDLAQEQIYQAYAIEQLDKRKNKTSIAKKETYQSLVSSNNSANDKPVSSLAPDTQTVATTTATPTNVLASQTTNNNFLLTREQQINQIIESLSEVEQDALMEKTVLLFEQWESTADAGLDLALKMQHQKSQPNITYQDFLYDLAQSQVYREYAIEQLELAKENSFGFIEPLVHIEKVYCDKLTNANDGNVDEPIFDEPIFDNVSQAAKDESNVQLLDTNNDITINDELTTNNNSDTFVRAKSVFDDVSQVSKENVANEKSLDCHQTVSNSQGHPERITSLKDCVGYNITRASSKGCNFFIKSISPQAKDFLSTTYYSKNTLSLIKANKALLTFTNQGTLTNFCHPPSLPP